jgi:hypothetical protein
VSSDFTVGALALADRRSNAVGAVRLTLLPEALEIELVRAAGFTEGFAPGSVAEAARFQVPYSAVRGLVRSGRTLLLSLDPAISSPHTRFALARFTEDPAEALARAWQARAVARWARTLLPIPLGLLAALLTPSTLVSGSLGRASLAASTTGLLWLGLREIVAFRTWGGPFSDRLRDDFELKLSRKLGVVAVDRDEPRALVKARKLRPSITADAPVVEIPDLLVPRASTRRTIDPPAPAPSVSAPSLVLEAPSRAAPSHEAPSQAALSHEAPLHEAPLHEAPSHAALSHEALSHAALSHEAPSAPPPPTDLARPSPLPPAPPLPLPLLEAPAQPRLPEPPARSAPPRALAPRFVSPRVLRPALLVAAASLGLVGLMLFLQRYAAPKTPPPAVAVAIKGLASAAARVRPDPDAPVDLAAEPRPRCVCLRPDSPLWSAGLPALGILTYTADDQLAAVPTPAVDGRGHPRYAFDLAVVNNTARPLVDVRVTLTFARRTKAGRRVGATDRGLFWGGALAPGHAVKWHVKAPGSELTMDTSVSGVIDKDGIAPAPAEAFVELASSRARALRVHAVTMLAYLGDARARDLALSLGAQSPEERGLLAQVLRATSPLRVCAIAREGDHLGACVFNASMVARSDLLLRALPSSPEAGEPARYRIGGALPVHEGLRVEVPLEGPKVEAPAEWELVEEKEP